MLNGSGGQLRGALAGVKALDWTMRIIRTHFSGARLWRTRASLYALSKYGLMPI